MDLLIYLLGSKQEVVGLNLDAAETDGQCCVMFICILALHSIVPVLSCVTACCWFDDGDVQ